MNLKKSDIINKKEIYMLLKNKIYLAIIIVVFIICSIIGLNKNIIENPLGEKFFYSLGFLFFVLLSIGTTKNRKH